VQGYTDNPLFGVTRNPWDPQLTPGGSSGGAVAAVAAGLAPLAIGTDAGGSIRRPASHTGLVGLKPSQGRAPRFGGFPVITPGLEVVGPLTRTVADAAALFAVLAGPDSRDPASARYQPFSVDLDRAPARQRILFIPRFGASPVDPAIASSVAAAARDLAALGHDVEESTTPFDVDGLNAVWPVLGQTGVAWLMRGHRDWQKRIGPSLAQMAEAGARLSAADYLGAIDKVEDVRRQLGEAFERVDMLLTPTAAALPWPAHEIYPPSIDGKPVGPRGHAVFTAFVNAAGCPAISLPSAPSPEGLPIGIQLVAPWGGEERLLQLAAQFERARPWADRWPASALG
jgi:aspartyl-tRNA(Asn)/glutamyl-tRNA(Gln) amidotransferase subunit A